MNVRIVIPPVPVRSNPVSAITALRNCGSLVAGLARRSVPQTRRRVCSDLHAALGRRVAQPGLTRYSSNGSVCRSRAWLTVSRVSQLHHARYSLVVIVRSFRMRHCASPSPSRMGTSPRNPSSGSTRFIDGIEQLQQALALEEFTHAIAVHAGNGEKNTPRAWRRSSRIRVVDRYE
ncbi:MAG: hypothetical protein WA208_04295 [Thermoanaerobaculia bacterium]